MFWVFAAISLFMLSESIVTLFHVMRFKRFFLRNSGPKQPGVFPKVALFAPCKGLDFALAKNIQSWFDQDYPDLTIFFILDSEQDPARAIISTFPRANLIIAGPAVDSGQKVHNLRYAVNRIPSDYEIFAFVDSDCHLKPDWLRNLVSCVMSDPDHAATGYRWFTRCDDFGSILRSAWNSSVLTLYKEQGTDNFAWGGSTAILRKTFESAKVLEFWKGSISDDFSLTNALKNSGRRVNFVPGSMAFTADSVQFRDFFRWAFRQLLITRVYHPKLWSSVFLFHCAWVIWVITGLFFPFYFFPVFLFTQFLQGIKADLRWQCIRQTGEASPEQRILLWLSGPLVGVCNFLLTLSTIFTRKITWRNVDYTLLSANQLIVHHR